MRDEREVDHVAAYDRFVRRWRGRLVQVPGGRRGFVEGYSLLRPTGIPDLPWTHLGPYYRVGERWFPAAILRLARGIRTEVDD